VAGTPGDASARKRPVRVHATNITGEGASQLVQSLLPAIERVRAHESSIVYLPDEGPLATYESVGLSTALVRVKRYLPNAISRFLECTLFAGQFKGDGPLLVLGDIPLRYRGRQTVFVQTTLLTHSASVSRSAGRFKYRVSRALFRLNSRFAAAFIVQTEAMKRALSETYPDIAERINIVGQPPPNWLLSTGVRRTGTVLASRPGLRLFYPAAPYPHKNHHLLSQLNENEGRLWPVASLTLTVDDNLNPNPKISWMQCVGRLASEEVVRAYASADALLFLSLTESFGFPLAEAMWIGLPIICPDLPYSRFLCGADAIYFDPYDVRSLHAAIIELDRRLTNGWWPNWSSSLEKLPSSWDAVASAMLEITMGQIPATRADWIAQ
jgi:glycosyltransferase involved in cell wall biosynthesis